jgi:hypothetical protein
MKYEVIEVSPVPVTALAIQDEIRDATSDGAKLVCIEIDPPRDRLLIIVSSKK